MKKRKFWRVKIQSEEYSGENWQYYVVASSAAEAESRGLLLAKKDIAEANEKLEIMKPYCESAEFTGYVYG